MPLSVCLLPDEAADRAVRRLWRQLESDGIPTLATHTHGRHVPHLTLAALDGAAGFPEVVKALATLPPAGPTSVPFLAFASFTRSRCWLLPAATTSLLDRQEAVVDALRSAGVGVHRHYLPGVWIPHLTLTSRLPVELLPTVARRAYEVLPLAATLDRAAVVDTSSGEIRDLPHPV